MAHDLAILEASKKHPLPTGMRFAYGTAGFRMKSDILDAVTFRVGLLASLRSRHQTSMTIGIMITASHNPPPDNGVKIVDPLGEMLESDWEKHATDLVNCATDEELVKMYNHLASSLEIDLSKPAKVIYGRDTRPSGHTLGKTVADALKATNTEMVDYALLTTPQLHYLVRCDNTKDTLQPYGEVSEMGYYNKLAAAFMTAIKGKPIQGRVRVDCANGVGALKLAKLMDIINKNERILDVEIINGDVIHPERLNLDCGADFVKTKQRAPVKTKQNAASAAVPNLRCCSFDGDVDRLVYYRDDSEKGFFLLDGDRIAILAAGYINDLVKAAGLEGKLRVGVVQTAYANGASTKYISHNLRLPVTCTPTGVKYLHHAAGQYEIGVYFEANGHGTVCFSSNALESIVKGDYQSPGQQAAMETLQALADLINQTVGDAISDMLMVEVILANTSWSLDEWQNTYQELPNCLVRVEVKDKDRFLTTDAERKLTHPAGAQDEIDDVVQKFSRGRSFARASGTENACRVYAEAATTTEAQDLAYRVAAIVRRYGNE